MIIILLSIAAAIAALAGGYTALHSRSHLHSALALTSGLILGLVAFDLLPEVFEGSERAGIDLALPMALFVSGFLLFHAVEKLILVHEGPEHEYGPHSHPKLGIARAVALAGHSFLDGLSIGVAFQVNTTVGLAVALAVIGHRFADGFDTANFMLLHRNSVTSISRLLAFVVAAPIVGGLLSLFVHFSEGVLSTYLGFFAGLLMYIASSNILPQAHAKDQAYRTIGLTVLGVVLIFIMTRFASV